MGRSAIRTLALVAAVAAVVPLAAAPVAAAAADPDVVSIEILTPQIDAEQGWADATVSVHIRHAVGLPDTMRPLNSDNTSMVTAGRGGGYPGAPWITWPELNRVSGTSTDGVWQDTVRLSPAWAGAYTVSQVQVSDLDGQSFYLPVTNGPTITAKPGDVWAVTSVRNPVKIVTGNERWRPQAVITRTQYGIPAAGARVRAGSIFDNLPSLSALATTPGNAADANGLWTSPVMYGVQDGLEARNYAYGGRGGRGWSLQGLGCVDITVKLQASSTYSDTSLVDDQALVVTGNLWPAPSVFGLDAPINLQRNLGAAGWQTLTTATARFNGRYTLTWYPLAPGTYELRVRLPGNGSVPCATGTVGTTLASTTATVRWTSQQSRPAQGVR
jgi:hypothetical protein